MAHNDFSDYAVWMSRANDPSESAEAREQYRERMQAYVHLKMREAFAAATQSARATNGGKTQTPT